MALNPQSRDLAIRTLLGEAGNQPPEGMLAVANVIKNRTLSGAWGDPYSGHAMADVIRAPKQFSLWNEGDSAGAMARSISANDPRYVRAGAIVDAVFNNQAGDNTGGATHYYNPSIANPDWGNGPGLMIGAHKFMKLPLTASNTAGTAVTGPSSAPPSAPLDEFGNQKPLAQAAVSSALANAKTMLGKNEVPNHDEIVSYLHDGGQDLDPHKAAWCAAFVSASLQKAGLPVPKQVIEGSAYGAGAWAPNYLTYGSAVNPNDIQAGDILVRNDGHHVGFAEGSVRQGPNGPEVQMLAGNERDASGAYAPGAGRAQVGQVGETWVPLSEYSARRYTPADSSTAVAANAPAAPTATDQPFKPYKVAGAMQPPPASATTPAPAAPQPQSAASASAPAAPANDKYQVLQGMTTGTGRNPMLYTAANLGSLFGGASTSAQQPAARAPAPAPAPAPAAPVNTPIGGGAGNVLEAPTGAPPPPPVGNAWSQRPSGQPPPPPPQATSASPDLIATMQRLLGGLYGTG